MKTKFLFLILFVCCFNLKGQILFEDSTTLLNGTGIMAAKMEYLVHLRYAGDKYISYDTVSINLYNLNYSLYKNIPIPNSHLHGAYQSFFVKYVSETLFDTDSSTIEYMLAVVDGSVGSDPPHLYIYDEFGTQLFFKDSVWYDGSNITGGIFKLQPPILNTSAGTKMFLSKNGVVNNLHPIIYSLPGTLYTPCDCFTSSGSPVIISENPTAKGCQLKSYPNPSNEKTTIEYKLPEGIHVAELRIVSLEGNFIKKYQITDHFNKVELNNSDIPAGNYMYQVLLPDGNSLSKKMMVIH